MDLPTGFEEFVTWWPLVSGRGAALAAAPSGLAEVARVDLRRGG